MSVFDPFRSSLDVIGDGLEQAGDHWRTTLNLEAEAENEYRRVHAIAWAQASNENMAVTIRAKHCENQPVVVSARCDWNIAVAREKAAHSKVEEQRNRLMSAMSDQRYMREASGG